MSDTPRTDKHPHQFMLTQEKDGTDYDWDVIETEFARQLERELADLSSALRDIEMETRRGGQWTPAEVNEVARAALAKTHAEAK